LREARGYRRVTTAEVAAATRVTPEYVEALESGEWGKIPAAYLRGYLSLYASAVGMNREKVLRTFDRLLADARDREGAVLDQSGPLLPQPEHVGVTRAKIRTSWFAGMARNRRAVFCTTAVVIVALSVTVHLVRRATRETVAVTAFEQATLEAGLRVHGPFTLLPLDSLAPPGGEKRPVKQAMWVGRRSALLLFQRDDGEWEKLRFATYDTIAVEYRHHLIAKVTPRDGAVAFSGDTAVPHDTTIADTALYRVPQVSKASISRLDSLADTLNAAPN